MSVRHCTLGLQNGTTGAVRASMFYQPRDVAHGGVSSSERAALGRGCHTSTFRLNVSALCEIGGAFRGYLGGA
jgi:hypothetical protein